MKSMVSKVFSRCHSVLALKGNQETVQAEGKSYLDNAIRRGEVCAGGARALVSGRADEGRPEPGADGPSG